MELKLTGFDDWCIDTGHNEQGKRWAEVYRKTGPNYDDWEHFGHFPKLGDALDCLIEEGLELTEEQVADVQMGVVAEQPQWRQAYGV